MTTPFIVLFRVQLFRTSYRQVPCISRASTSLSSNRAFVLCPSAVPPACALALSMQAQEGKKNDNAICKDQIPSQFSPPTYHTPPQYVSPFWSPDCSLLCREALSTFDLLVRSSRNRGCKVHATGVEYRLSTQSENSLVQSPFKLFSLFFSYLFSVSLFCEVGPGLAGQEEQTKYDQALFCFLISS